MYLRIVNKVENFRESREREEVERARGVEGTPEEVSRGNKLLSHGSFVDTFPS